MTCKPPLGASPFQGSIHDESRAAAHHIVGKAVTKPVIEALSLNQVLL